MWTTTSTSFPSLQCVILSTVVSWGKLQWITKEVLPERSYDSLSLCPLSPASQLSFPLLEGKFRHPSLVFVAMWASAPRGTHLLTAAIAAFPPRPKLKGGYCKPTTCSSLCILKKRVQVELKCSRCFHHLRFSTNNIVFWFQIKKKILPVSCHQQYSFLLLSLGIALMGNTRKS